MQRLGLPAEDFAAWRAALKVQRAKFYYDAQGRLHIRPTPESPVYTITSRGNHA